jgi:hypothetical protein
MNLKIKISKNNILETHNEHVKILSLVAIYWLDLTIREDDFE